MRRSQRQHIGKILRDKNQVIIQELVQKKKMFKIGYMDGMGKSVIVSIIFKKKKKTFLKNCQNNSNFFIKIFNLKKI